MQLTDNTRDPENRPVLINTARVHLARCSNKMTIKESAARLGISPREFKRWSSPSGYTVYIHETKLHDLASAFKGFLPTFFVAGDEESQWDSIDDLSRQIDPWARLPSGRK